MLFASQPEIRETIHRIVPIKNPAQSAGETHKHLVEACKNCNLCAKCGRPRNVNNDKHHQACFTNHGQCLPQKTTECRNNSCSHPLHPIQLIWRFEEISFQADAKLVEKESDTFSLWEKRLNALPSSLTTQLITVQYATI